MSEKTKIQWADDTWNPWRGCRAVSPGCENCYAEALVERFHGKGAFKKRVRSGDATFYAPLKWNKSPWICDGCGHAHKNEHWENDTEPCCPDRISLGRVTRHRRRVFSLSLGDIWDPEVAIEDLADALDVIRRCPGLDLLLLTKRPELWPERMEGVLKWIESQPGWGDGEKLWPMCDLRNWLADWYVLRKPPANVWIGATVEDQKRADERVPELLKIPAVCRFLSVEPQLEAVDLSKFIPAQDEDGDCTQCGLDFNYSAVHQCPDGFAQPKLQWVIVGGESGPGARPFNVEWARSIVGQCKAAGVVCFVKQLGAAPVQTEFHHAPECRDDECCLNGDMHSCDGQVMETVIPLKDKKGGDPSEWPAELRVREFPVISSRAPSLTTEARRRRDLKYD